MVDIPRGASFSGLLSGMRRDGLLGDPGEERLRRWGARLYSAFTGLDARLYVGEYQLVPGDSLLTLLEKIDRGEVMQRNNILDLAQRCWVRRVLSRATTMMALMRTFAICG